MTAEPSESDRLDHHAAAIRKLRKQVADLQDVVIELRSMIESRPVSDASDTPDTGPFKPSAHCVMCGATKPAGRTALTCSSCSALRNAAIAKGGDRASILRTECVSCGATFTRATRLLCVPCSAGFDIWKAIQPKGK